MLIKGATRLDFAPNGVNRYSAGDRDRRDSVLVFQFQKSHYAPVSHPTMRHLKQKYKHFCSGWCVVRYGSGTLCDLGNGLSFG